VPWSASFEGASKVHPGTGLPDHPFIRCTGVSLGGYFYPVFRIICQYLECGAVLRFHYLSRAGKFIPEMKRTTGDLAVEAVFAAAGRVVIIETDKCPAGSGYLACQIDPFIESCHLILHGSLRFHLTTPGREGNPLALVLPA
jgi:hypothetical protein